MTDQSKDGGPAFPGPSFTQGGVPNGHSMGMSLRDAAALAALPAIIAATSAGLHDPGQRGALAAQSIEDRIAADAYEIADAMMAAREGGDA